MIALRLLVALCLSTLLGCTYDFDEGGSGSGPEDELGRVSGQVVTPPSGGQAGLSVAEDEGFEPVEGAICTLEGTSLSAETDAAGQFEIAGVADGSYILICKLLGSDSSPTLVALEIVEVEGGNTISLGVLIVTPPGALSGTALLADADDHSGVHVYLLGTSYEATSDADGRYFIGDVARGTYELLFEKTGYSSITLSDVQVDSNETTELAAIALALSTGVSGNLVLNNGSAYTDSRTVSAVISASDDVALMQLSESASFVNTPWESVRTLVEWEFASDGLKTLYARFSDHNGLESAPASASITIDTAAPDTAVLLINGGSATTASPTVTLTISAADLTTSVSEMILSEDSLFVDASWEPYVEGDREWLLEGDDGLRTIYAKFSDLLGNAMTGATSASIRLDRSAPGDGSIEIVGGDWTNSVEVDLVLSATDAVTMSIWDERLEVWNSDFETDSGWVLSEGDGLKSIFATFKDSSGNLSDTVSDSVHLDATPPSAAEIAPMPFFGGEPRLHGAFCNENIWETVSHDYTQATSYAVHLQAASADNNFAHYEVQGGEYGDWQVTAASDDFEFSLIEETEVLRVRGVDQAGNVGPAACIYVTQDALPPVIETDPPILVSSALPSLTFAFPIRSMDFLLQCHVSYGVTSAAEETSVVLDQDDFSGCWDLSGDGTWSDDCPQVELELPPQSTIAYRWNCVDAAGNISQTDEASFDTGTPMVDSVISEDFTMTQADSPYWVGDQIQVASGATLAVEPGASVVGTKSQFAWSEVLVGGVLNVAGIDDNPARFNKIKVTLASGGSAQIDGVYWDGFYAANECCGQSSQLVLRNSTLVGGYLATELYPTDQPMIIEKNRFLQGLGIRLYPASNWGSVHFKNNLVFEQDPSESAVYIHSNPNIEFTHNSFLSTDRVAVEVGQYFEASGNSPLNAAYNYWGTTDSAIIDTMIHDSSDDITLIDVFYVPSLTEPHPDTPSLP